MPKFRSPLGDKDFTGPSLKEFDVPDESEMTPAMRMHGPAPHGPQEPIDIRSAMEFQERMRQQRSPQDDDEIERQIRAAREAKRLGRERLGDGAKRRVEMLLEMTRSTREVDLNGTAFVLQTLRSKEMREAMMIASEYDGTVQSPFEVRRQLLSRSIVSVANVDFAQFVGSDSLEAKLELIDSLDEALLNRLFDEYSALVKDSRDKYAIKNDRDAEEVVEDLKK